jgi:anti-sigma factor ChrR (cupin superfamily)
MNHDPSLGDPQELASLYAAGALPPEERDRFESHLAGGCDVCGQELAALMASLHGLAAGVAPVPLNPQTRARLLQQVAASASRASRPTPLQPHLSSVTPSGPVPSLLTLRADEGDWVATSVPGVRIRTLYVDRERDQYTALVRMSAGSSYPRHVHGGPEHCLVLEGDLHIGDEVLHPGDYQVAPAGSRHGVQTTERGCLLFITSSLHDEF